MKLSLGKTLLGLGAALAVSLLPLQAEASRCSTSMTSGNWAYTYTGTVFTPAGAAPAASVGHYFQDLAGNITGGQSRSVAGTFGAEDITGTVTVNKDCTASGTINVLVNGQLQRTAQLDLVYNQNHNHVRMIFRSLALPDGTNVPVVLTIDGSRVSIRDN